MKRFILLLLIALLATGCACGKNSDAALIGMALLEAQQSVNGTETRHYDPCVWRVKDGFLVIGASDDRTTVRSVVCFSKEGELTEQINVSTLTDANPSQWVGRTTQELYAQIGEPHYDMGVVYCQRPIAAYLTDEGKICYLYLLDDRVSLVRVCDVFSDETALYPSGKVQLEEGAHVTLIYHDADTAVEVELPAAEAEQIAAIFNGKERYSEIPTEPLCGFYDELAFRIGDRLFCPASDTCCIAMEYETGLMIDLSQEERDTIDAIFAAHGYDSPYQ